MDKAERVTDTELAEAMRVCEAATPPPWDATSYPIETATGEEIVHNVVLERNGDGSCFRDIWNMTEADAKHMALARTLLPRLIAEVQESRNRKGEGDANQKS